MRRTCNFIALNLGGNVADLLGIAAAGRRHMMTDDGVEAGVPSHGNIVRRCLNTSMRKAFFQPFIVLYGDLVGVLAVDGLVEWPTRIHAPSGLAKLIGTELAMCT
jgi:hypothetical protein